MIRAPLSAVAAVLLAGCSTSLSSYFDFGGPTPALTQTDGGYRLGKTQMRAGDYGLAIDSFRTALSRHPKSIEILNGLAIAYAKIGRPEQATFYFGEALALEPRSVFTLSNLNYFYWQHGDKPHALAYGKRARDAKQRLADEGQSDLPANVNAAIDRNLALAQGTAKPPALAQTAPVQTQDLAPLADAAAKPPAPVTGPPVSVAARTASAPARAENRAVETTSAKASAALHPPTVQTAKHEMPTYRVSNGVGIRGLAGRTADYLASHGIEVRALTNEKSFDYRYSLIFYNPGLRSYAAGLAGQLPMRPRLVEAKHGTGEVELILGADATAMAEVSGSGGSGA